MPPSQNLVNFGRQTGLDYVVHFTHLLQIFVGGKYIRNETRSRRTENNYSTKGLLQYTKMW